MAWYLPWHLPILPAQIESIFRSLIPRSESNAPRSSSLHPTVHRLSSLPSNTPAHLLSLVKPISTPTPRKPQNLTNLAELLLQQLHLQQMEFLEIQFEPISFRLYSLSASSPGGSLLTVIAVLAAAAVGFWRIRTVGSKTDGSGASHLFTAPLEETQKKVAPLVQSREDEASVSPACAVDRRIETVDTPKVRFTAYFEKEDCIGCCHVEDEEEEPTVDDGAHVEFVHREVELPWEREEVEVTWEGVVSRRRGDLGWYSYQDMAVLNGSVVRLWDGESPRRRKGSIAISSF